MLYLLSGASASGKKTSSLIVANEVGNIVRHHENEIPANNRKERMAHMERWVERAMEYEREGKDLLLLAASPLGELLASPKATQLSGIAACLLDCHDHERRRRYIERGTDPRWPIDMDMLCWAAFHRMHAVDPQFEQHVLREPGDEKYEWQRWTSWTGNDPRWRVELIDNTRQSVDETVVLLVAWIDRTRAAGAPLRREMRWWQ